MIEKNPIAEAEYACTTIESATQRQALMDCAALINDPDNEECLVKVRNSLPALRELVEKQKRAESVIKSIKEITEPAIYMVKKAAEEARLLKFSKESFTKKIPDTRALFERMIQGGTPADKILEFATISVKDAAECLGLSETAFCDTFADLIESTPRKPTMKAI